MKTILLIFLVSLTFSVFAQIDTLVDERDGQTYPIAQINGLWWMLDNLNLDTERSKSKEDSKRELDPRLNGRWYHQEELKGICPYGWRLPSAQDWFNYFDLLMADANASYKLKQRPADLNLSGYDDKVSLFEDGNPLQLISTGIFQGEDYRHSMGEQADYWILDLPAKNSDASDSFKPMKKVYPGTSHIHLHDPFSQIHSHDHHLDPSDTATLRRFMVRCVCEEL